MTYIIMCLILSALAFSLLYKAHTKKDTSHFFDLDNTVVMRGFWCIIILLVHTPAAYQNKIQDIAGSFAYIGVTFFFMTSAYGLKVSAVGKPDMIKFFWRKRLLKLLIPVLLANALKMLMSLAEGREVSWKSLISVNTWVLWMLGCYFIYWAVNRFLFIRELYRDLLICLLIAAASAVIFSQKDKIASTTWCAEVFGFIWGIALANIKKPFCDAINRKWLLKSAAFCALSAALGAAYLKFKTVPFYGEYMLKIVLGLAITLFILAVNVKISFGNKLGLFLGGISYEVYLLHGAVFTLVEAFLPKLNSGAFIGLVIIITVVLSRILNAVSKPIIKEVNKKLQGQTK